MLRAPPVRAFTLAALLLLATLFASAAAAAPAPVALPADGEAKLPLAHALKEAADDPSTLVRVALGVQEAREPSMRHALPSEALLAIPGATPTPGMLAALADLDALDAPLRNALVGVVDAFLEMDALARDPARIAADVAGARVALVDAAGSFKIAREAAPVRLATVDFCPTFAIDLEGRNDHYTQDCAFILDVAGDDDYQNNAGGANWNFLAAAALDFAGRDEYGYDSHRTFGQNGGAYGATVGFLYDGLGDDVYLAGYEGANGGGAYGGSGFLLDLAGSDRYEATSYGTNGGAYGLFASTYGMLLDAEGYDTYMAGAYGTNGGGYSFGSGFLFDAAWNDAYYADAVGTNGGGAGGGVGTLVDASGNDRYEASDYGINGGSYSEPWEEDSAGTLIDLEGADAYSAYSWLTYGVNGGVKDENLGSGGFLYDAGHAGDSYYESGFSACSGTGYDRTVVPKCDGGAQIDGSGDPLALVNPRTDPRGDGTCDAYNDTNRNGARDPGETGERFPCPRPRSSDDPDGTCTLYDDENANNAHDPGEGVAVVPCPDPRFTQAQGSAVVYDDKDDDGQLDPGEEIARTPADLDADGVPDAVEPTLCAQNNPNYHADGTCVGDDWTAPAHTGLLQDVERLLQTL